MIKNPVAQINKVVNQFQDISDTLKKAVEACRNKISIENVKIGQAEARFSEEKSSRLATIVNTQEAIDNAERINNGLNTLLGIQGDK